MHHLTKVQCHVIQLIGFSTAGTAHAIAVPAQAPGKTQVGVSSCHACCCRFFVQAAADIEPGTELALSYAQLKPP
jgi:hypothetical protein